MWKKKEHFTLNFSAKFVETKKTIPPWQPHQNAINIPTNCTSKSPKSDNAPKPSPAGMTRRDSPLITIQLQNNSEQDHSPENKKENPRTPFTSSNFLRNFSIPVHVLRKRHHYKGKREQIKTETFQFHLHCNESSETGQISAIFLESEVWKLTKSIKKIFKKWKNSEDYNFKRVPVCESSKVVNGCQNIISRPWNDDRIPKGRDFENC